VRLDQLSHYKVCEVVQYGNSERSATEEYGHLPVGLAEEGQKDTARTREYDACILATGLVKHSLISTSVDR
jgi:hypothetical protein